MNFSDNAARGRWQFQKANTIDPDQGDIHYWLGTIYRHLGDKSRTAEEMQAYESLMKNKKYGSV